MSSERESRWLDREDFDNVTVVRLKTPKVMDEYVIREIFDPIVSLIEAGRSQLVLNFAVVDHVSSMALGKLIVLNSKVRAAKGRLALCHLAPAVEELLEIVRLKPLFKICVTEQEALKYFL